MQQAQVISLLCSFPRPGLFASKSEVYIHWLRPPVVFAGFPLVLRRSTLHLQPVGIRRIRRVAPGTSSVWNNYPIYENILFGKKEWLVVAPLLPPGHGEIPIMTPKRWLPHVITLCVRNSRYCQTKGMLIQWDEMIKRKLLLPSMRLP